MTILHFFCRTNDDPYGLDLSRTNSRLPPIPHGIKIFKGVKNVIVTREFAEFVLNDPVAIDFYHWLQLVSVPDEYFFQSLYRIDKAMKRKDGTVFQRMEMNTTQYLSPRYTIWGDEEE